MADADKTVRIIFTGDTGDAQNKIDQLSQSLANVGTQAPTGLTAANEAIAKTGDASVKTAEETTKFSDALKKLGDEAGLPVEKIDNIAASFVRLGAPTTGAVAVAAASVIAFGLAGVIAGGEALQFKTKIENLTGSASRADEEFKFLQGAVRTLEEGVDDTANSYVSFLTQIQGTAISTDVARNAFLGIADAVDSVGGGFPQIDAALKSFADAAKDGDISVRDLDTKIRDIPGGLTIFADTLGVTREQLYEMAENGRLGKIEIAQFAEALKNTERADLTRIGSAFSDLINVAKQAAIALGAESGVEAIIWAIEKSLRTLTLAIDIIGGSISVIATTVTGFFSSLIRLDFADFGTKIAAEFDRASTSIGTSAGKLVGLKTGADQVKQALVDAGQEGGAAIVRGIEAATTSFKSVDAEAKRVNETLKALGIDPKSFVDPLTEVIGAFETLAKSPVASGEQFLSGFLVTLDKISTSQAIKEAPFFMGKLGVAVADGKLSAEQATAAYDAWNTKVGGLWDTMIRGEVVLDKNTSATLESAKAAKEAEDKQNKFRVEMEKLASNERIKLFESKIKLDIAEVEANAKIAVAAFSSIDKTIENTGKTLTDMFGILARGTTDWTAFRLLTQSIETESKHREAALQLQQEMIRAQIENTRARTKALERGETLLKVEGAGLQPHLEAFMWEILRTIQVRVNKDGLALLTGA